MTDTTREAASPDTGAQPDQHEGGNLVRLNARPLITYPYQDKLALSLECYVDTASVFRVFKSIVEQVDNRQFNSTRVDHRQR